MLSITMKPDAAASHFGFYRFLDKSMILSIIMKKKRRRMSGLNTKIEHKGILLHVQTQDTGTKARHVESLIYTMGKLIASRKTPYTPFLSSPNLEERIDQIIKEQHENILKEIAEGRFDHFLTSGK